MRKLLSAKYLFWIILLPCFFLVLTFLVRSGYGYQFDHDEFHHSQITYLMDQGQQLYTYLYVTYPPIFYWMLLPLYRIIGYGIEVLYASRMLMVALYLIRVGFLYLLLQNLVSKRAAFLGVFLFILDPILAMSSFQIRPDNLMMTAIIIALYVYSEARIKKSRLLFILSGVFFSLSVLSLMKILPTIAVFFAVAIVSSIQRKRMTEEGVVIGAFFITTALFLGILMIQGIFAGFVEQSWIDPLFIFALIQYPIPYGFYFKEGNNWIFGPGNRPLPWVFAQLLFPLSGIGLATTFDTLLHKKVSPLVRDLTIIIVGSLIGQWIWLLLVPSIFVQYYLPINWCIAALGAFAIENVFRTAHEKKGIVGTALFATIITFFCVFSVGSYKANTFRLALNSDEITTKLTSIWKAVPEHSPVFPPVLFRPVIYNFPYRMPFPEVPEVVLRRFPTLKSQLIEKNLQYVYNDTYYISNIPLESQEYIRTFFVPGGVDDQIFVRKVE